MDGSNRASSITVECKVGRGTGKGIANVFERVMTDLSIRYSVSIDLQRSQRVFHSYKSLVSDFGDQSNIERETTEDVKQ